jgi:homoserine dehydrogenase
LIARTAGEAVNCRILIARFCDLPYANLFTKDSADVVDNPQIDNRCGCMGGVEPAATFIDRALKIGRCGESN